MRSSTATAARPVARHSRSNYFTPRLVALVAALVAAGCGGSSDDDDAYAAQIRRTTLGVPHIQADNYKGLGYGTGYAQAEDVLCTLADAFLTYRGERSRWFGGTANAAYGSTIGQPVNLESDFFHRHVMTDDKVQAMAAAQTEPLRHLVDGFVRGYNRYLADLKAGRVTAPHSTCASEAWVQPITTNDIYRRWYHAMLAGGYSNFLPQIASAVPPGTVLTTAAPSTGTEKTLAVAGPTMHIGGEEGVGSNMIGFGADGTADGQPLLFGNPHWYWRGADRFYQAQISIPGHVRVSGAQWPGIPIVLIGYNDNVAWSHTVSEARRFGFFELTLAAGTPTSYMKDGQTVAMRPKTIDVQVRQNDGTLRTVTRTLYASEYGPLVNLAPLNAALAWTATKAYAIRDINADNYRAFRSWFGWNQAGSLDELMEVQRRESAVPWVNTVAIGRNAPRAYYGDIGTMPNVTPAQVASCTTTFGQAVAATLPRVPFFDGSRAECQWRDDADSKQAGAIGTSRMPSLLRRDYVANMNDSFWLTNPNEPLTGYPDIVGAVAGVQSFRSRLGHLIAQGRIAGTDGAGAAGATPATVQSVVLNSRNYTAELFKAEAMALVCQPPFASQGIADACGVLTTWNDTGNTDARGAHVWDEFWRRAARIPAASLYAVPFSAADPVNTPRGLQPSAAAPLRTAFADAVTYVQGTAFALDAARGDYLYATRAGQRIGLYGGCGGLGYFTIACSERSLASGNTAMDGDPNGNSYMQIVRFPVGGTVEASTFLTHGEPDNGASPVAAAYTQAYANKAWQRQPFTESEIAASTGLTTKRISE